MANILCEREDGCLRIRLSSGTANALTTAVIRDLANAVQEANRDARGAMLCGGRKFFCNGLDLDWALARSRAEIGEMFHALAGLILAMLESPLPIVGAIKGHAIGGGMAIYLACDYRYAAAGRVLIGKPEILLGVPNPYYGDQLLRFVAGDFVASDMIYTGKLVRAEEARALNLVHETGPKAEIEGVAWQRLLFLCDLAPDAFQESKRMRLGKFCADLREQMPTRIARQVEIWSGDEAQARLRAGAERLKRRRSGDR
ncbi:MAG: enoyl-CoA hydratase/isomerase family protein [Rhodospirillales bacterium]|nr:enoyl-CoA hydratase/isomerase family protein [Rhodospirillales bacterium]